METDATRKTDMINAVLAYGTISKACEAQGVSRSMFYRWRQDDPQFAADVRTALDALGMEEDEPEQAPEPEDATHVVTSTEPMHIHVETPDGGVSAKPSGEESTPPVVFDVHENPVSIETHGPAFQVSETPRPEQYDYQRLVERIVALEAAVELLSGDFVTPKLAQKFRELRDKLQTDYAARRNLQAHFQQMQGASAGLLTDVLDAFIEESGA